MFKAGVKQARGASALLALCLCASMPPAHADSAKPAVPVTASSDGIMDACNSVGRITGLDPKGDNFLSVRNGPGGKYTETDRLASDTDVFICDERSPWLGVIYPADDTTADCGTDAYAGEAKPYTGPCRSGWVHQKFVEVIAG